MKEQLTRIMEAEGMTPAKFADEIGVQRSSISHIISGRNKPSYDFIVKILNLPRKVILKRICKLHSFNRKK